MLRRLLTRALSIAAPPAEKRPDTVGTGRSASSRSAPRRAAHRGALGRHVAGGGPEDPSLPRTARVSPARRQTTVSCSTATRAARAPASRLPRWTPPPPPRASAAMTWWGVSPALLRHARHHLEADVLARRRPSGNARSTSGRTRRSSSRRAPTSSSRRGRISVAAPSTWPASVTCSATARSSRWTSARHRGGQGTGGSRISRGRRPTPASSIEWRAAPGGQSA